MNNKDIEISHRKSLVHDYEEITVNCSSNIFRPIHEFLYNGINKRNIIKTSSFKGGA